VEPFATSPISASSWAWKRGSTVWFTFRTSRGRSKSSTRARSSTKGTRWKPSFSRSIGRTRSSRWASNNWDGIQERYPLGTEVTGEVTNVTDFGAFVRLEDGIEGLVYSSELSVEGVDKPSAAVEVGQTVTALVTKVAPIDQKISLSIKAVSDREQRAALKNLSAQQSQTQTTTFGDLLKERLAQKSEE
jgi:predicted RNA-binding protein with RPS1 domain